MKEYKHLNLAQRSVISALKASGMKQKKIAVYAECSPSTVSRELARNKTKTGKYSPKVAQEISEERKERFRKERKFTKEMKVLVIKYISEEQWSVEQIVGYCRKNGIPIFFAHPYSSWERGLSEHTNGLVRQYIPKNTDFKDITDKEIKEYQYKINNRPRKVLDFEKPKDLFYQKVI